MSIETEQQADTYIRLIAYNRDLIRKAAKAAGVVNVTYKNKDENVLAMIDLKVVDVTEAGEPVYSIQAVQDVADAFRAEREAVQTLADDFVGPEPEVEVPIGDRSTEDLEAELDRLYKGNVRVGTADRIEVVEDELTARDEEAEYDPAQAYPDLEGDVLDNPEPDALDGVTYRLAMDGDGNSVLTLVADGNLHTVDSKDVLYARIVTALLAKEDPRPFLGTQEEQVAQWAAENLSDRVVLQSTANGHQLLIDGEVVDGKVVEQFKRYWLEGRDPQNILRFLERVASNPLTVAEHNLYAWDAALTIDPEGYFIGFKKVFPVRDEDGKVTAYRPSQRGPGEVNGVTPEDEWLTMNIGDVVTIDRELVVPGPECSVGLHVGTYNFAKSFSYSDGVVMEVKVDPADIVNVPHSTTGKLRCVRFEVLAFHTTDGRVDHLEPEATWDEAEAVAAVEDVFETPETKGFFRRIFSRKAKG